MEVTHGFANISSDSRVHTVLISSVWKKKKSPGVETLGRSAPLASASPPSLTEPSSGRRSP